MLTKTTYTASRTKLKLEASAFSDKGIKEVNEDAFAIDSPESPSQSTKGIVTVIADGVSHAKQAQKASQYCCEHFSQGYFGSAKTWSTSRIISVITNQINQELCNKKNSEINQTINQSINQVKELKPQWLTTFSGIIFKSATAHIFHVGDSQIALVRDGQITILTKPHNQKLANNNSILTRAMGADHHLKIDYQTVELKVNDYFLLTTDGVHEILTEKQILTSILQQKSSSISQNLVELASQYKSQDNMTCLTVQVKSVPHLQPDEIRKTLLKRTIPPALKPGQIIEGFKLIKNLYSSSRSHLYLVKELTSNKKFTLKIPSISFSDDEIYLQGFIREAWVGSQIDHPAIMKVYPTKTDTQFLYHICEYIEGQTLRQWMIDHPTPSLEQVRQIITQVVEALRVFKRLDIVHRDIKPENIMIDHQGKIKLIDYGTASIAALEEQVNRIVETHPLGTVDYLAPETVINLSSNYKSDFFSLGVMTYEMLTGNLPYSSSAKHKNRNKAYSQWQYQPATEWREAIPFWCDLALRKCVEPDPNDRYQLYSEFLTDISKPNIDAEQSFKSKPFIEREPIKFWKSVSGILALLVILLLFKENI